MNELEMRVLAEGYRARQPGPNQSLFRYISLRTKPSWEKLRTTLNELRLEGATPNSLNDPFELSPYRFDDLRPTTVATAIGYSPPIFDDEIVDDAEHIRDKFRDLQPFRAEAASYLDAVFDKSRIVAFCERSDAALLWSHYAASYKGACIHFLAKGFDGNPAPRMGFVRYSRYRPTYPLSLALRLARRESNVQRFSLSRAESDMMLFFTKAEDWAYEGEIRIVYDRPEKGIRFSPDGLASIILGPCMSSDDERELRSIVQDSPHPQIPIRRARLSQNSFSVDVEPAPRV